KKNFSKIYDVIDIAFPYEEKREKAEMEALLNEEGYHFCGIKVDDKNVGVLVYWDISDRIYVEYIAILPEYRNGGISSKVLSRFLEQAQSCVLEVEMPETEMALRRIGFYQRLGFVVNEYAYSQPSYHHDGVTTPMKVLSFPRALTEEEFRNVKSELYNKVYNYKE
ncbi:MAG: GNAT family N-acetyltransferase, partial [Clostridia bacterium]